MKKYIQILFLLTVTFSLGMGQSAGIKPVTPDASPEATALLKLVYSVSGNYILTGQHNYPNSKDRNTRFAADYIGKTPVIFSTDWGFEREGDKDSYLARPDIVKEAIRQHRNGAIVTICWHAVPPTAEEPVTFRPVPGASPDSLASVQGQLADQQFKDLLTPGTPIYKNWCKQVDEVAKYLAMLRDEHVPVLWRPYHEMNGSWFWWGGRLGKYSTSALYKQLFDRLVNYHKLNNLVWVWSVDRPGSEEMQFQNYYPGTKYLDILALDVYGNDFKQEYYDKLLALSEGKPIVLGEVGNVPSLGILKTQPRWAYYVVWAGMVRNTTKRQYDSLASSPRVLFQEDKSYKSILTPYRQACRFPPEPVSFKEYPDFTGNWIFNEDKSKLENSGASNVPYQLTVNQAFDLLAVYKTYILEYVDNRTDTVKVTLNGNEVITPFRNTMMKTTAFWSNNMDTLYISSKATVTSGDRTMVVSSVEKWFYTEGNNTLNIIQNTKNFWGEQNYWLAYNRVRY